jgi:hypothetical protein
LEEQIFTAIAKPRPPLLKSFLDSNELDRNWFIASFAADRRRSAKEECGLVGIGRSLSITEHA